MIEATLLQSLTNAVLALYGEPEPAGTMTLREVAVLLNRLAAAKRDGA